MLRYARYQPDLKSRCMSLKAHFQPWCFARRDTLILNFVLDEITNFLKLTCIARPQSNPWNSFLSLAVNTFSCCHFLYFWNYFLNILYIFVNSRLCVSDEMEANTRRSVGRPQLPGSLKSIRLGESVFNLWTGGKEALGFSECTDSEFAV